MHDISVPSIPFNRFKELYVIWLIAFIYCIAGGLLLGWERSSVENGFIENMQLVALFFADLVFAAAALKARSHLRVICLSAVWLMSMFWLREYEAEPGDGALSNYLGSRVVMRQWGCVLAIVAGAWLARGGWRSLPVLARYGFSVRIWPFFVAGLLLVLGDRMEKWHSQWAEESCELLAYCSFVKAAWWYYAEAKKQVASGQTAPF